MKDTNHLVKDSRFTVKYDDGDRTTFYDVRGVMLGLRHKRPDLYELMLSEIEKHFENLRDNEREEVRDFWPGKSAKDYFDEMNYVWEVKKKQQEISLPIKG